MRIPWKSLLAGIALTLAAGCGGGAGADSGVASLSGKDGSTTTAKDGATDKASRDEAFLAFTKCMREHGIDMPDPDTSGGGGGFVRVGPGAGAVAADGPAFDAADDACRHHLKDAMPQDVNPEERQKMQDAALAFAKCMREHGIDMPDPTFGDGGMIQQRIGGDGFNPEDPAFQQAEEACRELLPAGPGGPGVARVVDGDQP